MLLLTNHIGYETQGPKQAVLLCGQTQLMDDCVLLVCARSRKPLPSSLLSGTARSTTGIRDNFIVSIFPISRRQATIICAWNTRILPLLLLREAY